MVQWLGGSLPMQGTWVQSLVREDFLCLETTAEPVHLEPMLRTREATAIRSPQTSIKSILHLPQLAKARVQQQRPSTTKKRIIFLKKWMS